MPIAKLPGVEINFVDEGSTSNPTPILLVHGFSSSIRDNWGDTHWINFLVQNNYRVIAMDNRGHGKSEKFYNQQSYSLEILANDALALIDYLDIDRVHLLGYSMGARISAKLAMNFPKRVVRVILGGNGYGMIEGSGDWQPVYEGLLAPSIDDVSDLRARAFRRFAERTKSDREALAACLMGVRQLFTEAEFSKIKSRVLVAIGEDDDIAGSGQKLSDCMEFARYFPIPGRDHMRASADKLFKQEVITFLQSD